MVTDFYCVVAPQRSGTTVMQRALDATSEIKCFSEVFHSDVGRNKPNYFYFLRTGDERTARHCLPNAANMAEQFDDYMRYLRGLSSAPKLLIDVKQNSLHHMDTFWTERLGMPFFLQRANSSGMHFIRIKRRNLFLQALSTEVALARQKYHYDKHEDRSGLECSVHIDPQRVLSRMQVVHDEVKVVDRWLHKCNDVLWLDYEDLYGSTTFAPETADALQEFLGLDTLVRSLELPLQKAIRDPRALIENRGEVLGYFEGRAFDGMVKEAIG